MQRPRGGKILIRESAVLTSSRRISLSFVFKKDRGFLGTVVKRRQPGLSRGQGVGFSQLWPGSSLELLPSGYLLELPPSY